MSETPIQTGKDLFRATDDEFTFWFANGYGIHPSFDKRAYSDLSIEEAKEIRDELDELIEFCEQHQHQFGDL